MIIVYVLWAFSTSARPTQPTALATYTDIKMCEAAAIKTEKDVNSFSFSFSCIQTIKEKK